MTLFQLSYVLLWVLAIALVPISVVLLYLLAQLQERARGSSRHDLRLIGHKMPVSSVKDASSGMVRDIDEFQGQGHVVLALSPDCGSCRGLMNELASMSKDLADIRLSLLCMGDFERCKAAASGIHSVSVFVQDVRDDETMDLWFAGFPAALLVDQAGVVADVRHPLSFNGVAAAVRSVRLNDGDQTPEHELPRRNARASIG